jgi:hypothetical protein
MKTTNCSVHERCIWELALEGAKSNAETAIRRMEKAESRLAWAEGMVERMKSYIHGQDHDHVWVKLICDLTAGPEKETKE